MLQLPSCPSVWSSEALDYLMFNNFLGSFPYLIGKAAVVGSGSWNTFGSAAASMLSRDANPTLDLPHDVPHPNDPTVPPNADTEIALLWRTHG